MLAIARTAHTYAQVTEDLHRPSTTALDRDERNVWVEGAARWYPDQGRGRRGRGADSSETRCVGPKCRGARTKPLNFAVWRIMAVRRLEGRRGRPLDVLDASGRVKSLE